MLADLPKKSNDNGTGAVRSRETVSTPVGPMVVERWPYKVTKVPRVKRQKVWVHCKACGYRWVMCWAPVSVALLQKFHTDHCPRCHKEGQVFMGKPRGIIRAFIDGFKSGVTHGNR